MIQGKLPIFILKNRNCRRLRLAKDKKKEGEAMRIGTYNMIEKEKSQYGASAQAGKEKQTNENALKWFDAASRDSSWIE